MDVRELHETTGLRRDEAQRIVDALGEDRQFEPSVWALIESGFSADEIVTSVRALRFCKA